MPRHRLSALFEPRSLLILSSRELPVVQSPPQSLQDRILDLRVGDGPVALPARLEFLQKGQRLDQVLLSVDPARMPDLLHELQRLQPRSLIILPHEIPAEDPLAVRDFCQQWGRQNDCLVLGPGAMGIQRAHMGLNLGLESRAAPAGRVALVAQSRMIAAAVLDWAGEVQLGFSAVVSVGEAETVTVAEILEYLALDPWTDSIVLYLEHVESSRRFTSSLMAAASIKPVIVLKAGRYDSEPDMSSDAVFDALLRRTGAIRIRFFVQLFSALKVLVQAKRQRGRHIALFSNGYGAAHLALDTIGHNGPVVRAELSTQTRRDLRLLLEPGASIDNPVVSHAPLKPEHFTTALQLLANDGNVDGILVLLAPDVWTNMLQITQELAEFSLQASKPVISCFLGDGSMRSLRQRMSQAGLPALRSPEAAANAFGILASYRYNQTLARQTLPPEMLNRPPRLDEARLLLSDALMMGRSVLDRAGCRWLMDCFHVPILYEERAVPAEARQAVPMAIHVRQDARLGPYIQFGPGGLHAQLSSPGREIELPPLNGYLARQLIQRGKFWSRVLERSLSPAVFELLREALERVSEIISEMPAISTIAIDPIWSDDTSLFAGDVRVVLDPRYDGVRPEHRNYAHMAIHPYPRRLVRRMMTPDGQEWLLRPIRPEDAVPLQDFVRNLSEESRYRRFVSFLCELSPQMLARYTRIDYDREVALVATVQKPDPKLRGMLRETIVALAHYLRNADGEGAEYALVVADDWQQRGLGTALMRGIIQVASDQGLDYIEGYVLTSNRPMQDLMVKLGMQNDADPDDPAMRRIWLKLDGHA